jgi:uncharacterized protein (DUF983 family)
MEADQAEVVDGRPLKEGCLWCCGHEGQGKLILVFLVGVSVPEVNEEVAVLASSEEDFEGAVA